MACRCAGIFTRITDFAPPPARPTCMLQARYRDAWCRRAVGAERWVLIGTKSRPLQNAFVIDAQRPPRVFLQNHRILWTTIQETEP